MNFVRRCAMLLTFAAAFNLFTQSQTTTSSPTTANPPRLIRFAGIVKDASAKAGTVSATFALYSTADGGSPLWLETQSVDVTAGGHFSTILGSVSKDGVPMDFFVAGEARWLGITIDGKEQPRVLLVSVPYAMKAGDADTLGGLTASEIASQAATIVQQDGATTQKTGTSLKTSAAMQSSISNSSVLNYTASSFTDTNGTEVVLVQQNGTGYALHATSSANNSTILGVTSATGGTGVRGSATAATGGPQGVLGDTASPDGVGVYGHATATTSTTAIGVRGVSDATTGTTYGVKGTVSSPTGTGVFGSNLATTGAGAGLQGSTASTGGRGLVGTATATTGSTIGLLGFAASSGGTAVFAQETSATGLTVGMRASVASASGIGAVIDNSAGGDIFWGRGSGSVIKFKVDGSGNVTANGAVTAPTFYGALAGDATLATNLNAANLTNGIHLVANLGQVSDVIGGYSSNGVTTNVYGATIGGGGNSTDGTNTITDSYGFIGGGAGNLAGDNAGTSTDAAYATVGGGYHNGATGISSFVGGGNTNTASGAYSTVGGGTANTSSNNFAGVLSGAQNTASGFEAVISGGAYNTATANLATVSGGYLNGATGQYAVIPGGYQNTANGYASLAAGKLASAAQNNSFVWGDGSMTFSGLAFANAFSVLATGGVLFATHQTSGTVDQYASIGTSGLVTATGGFSGNGSALTNVDAISLHGTGVTNTAPVTGQALRYNGANWTPSNFVQSHYYPVGICINGSPTTYLWDGTTLTGSNFTCGSHGMALKLPQYGSGAIAGPDIEIPSDWDGSTPTVSVKFYMDTTPGPSQFVQVYTYLTCSDFGSTGPGGNSSAAIISTFVTDTKLTWVTDASVGALPGDCTANSILHFQVYRTDTSATGNMDILGMTVKFNRKQ